MASNELKRYVEQIGNVIRSGKVDLKVIRALFEASKTSMFQENDVEYSLKISEKCKSLLSQYVQRETGKSLWQIENYAVDHHQQIDVIDLYYEILKQESYHNFQSFMYYMEKNRGSKKRFYYPRRKTLKVVVDDLTALENREFKFYGLSMPSRVGKSTTCIFFLTWVMLKRPNSHSAMGGHSGALAKGFYKEVLNMITSPDYTFKELYEYWHPDHILLQDKSAEDFTITLDEPDRFATLTCRGQDMSWTGAIDISGGDNFGYLYVDDLVKNREMSLSPQRMEDCYQTYLNTMVDRKNDGAAELMVGTLWNVTDPLERIRIQNQDNPEYRFRRLPALNENGESNFNYDINGFSTKYYLEVKERLDDFEWQAKYQQKPYVREGLLFPTEELRMFDGLVPDEERRVVAVLDPAFGGGDALSMPICMDFGEKQRYIIDWVFNRGTQKTTVPLVARKIIEHYITELQIERNSGGQLLADAIKLELEKRGCMHCKINLVSAPVKMSKEDKIAGYSDSVKDNFIFLIPPKNIKGDTKSRYKRSLEYNNAMDEMCMYSAQGKNPHDDAADSMVQLAMFFEKRKNGQVDVIANPFKY